MAHPASWLPYFGDKRSRRVLLLGAALVTSLLAHVVLPFLRFSNVQAVSETPVIVQLMPPPPMPLPEADKLKDTLDDVDDPEPEPEPDEPDEPAPPPPPTKASPTPPEPEPVLEPEPPPVPAAPPTNDDSPLKKTAEERIAELERRRAERLALLEKRRAEREARREARRRAREAAGAPDTGEWRTGKPDSVYICAADDKGDEQHVTKMQPLTSWITIVPTTMTGFPTRPGLMDYVSDVDQVVSRERTRIKRIGFVEMALPNDVLQIELEEPRGVKIAVGRLDARCMIGFRYAQGLFPFKLTYVPARIIDRENNTISAVVDITFFKDVSIELAAVDGRVLPFTKGRIKNSKAIKDNIEEHFQAARLAKSIADLFGIRIGPSSAQQQQAPQPRVMPKPPREPRTAATPAPTTSTPTPAPRAAQ